MHKSFATTSHFMHKSFATGASSFTRMNSNVSCFAINVYKKAYRLNETRDEFHIHIYILGDKKNCSLKRYF